MKYHPSIVKEKLIHLRRNGLYQRYPLPVDDRDIDKDYIPFWTMGNCVLGTLKSNPDMWYHEDWTTQPPRVQLYTLDGLVERIMQIPSTVKSIVMDGCITIRTDGNIHTMINVDLSSNYRIHPTSRYRYNRNRTEKDDKIMISILWNMVQEQNKRIDHLEALYEELSGVIPGGVEYNAAKNHFESNKNNYCQ